MKCTKIEKWLSDSIDGELSGRKMKKLEAHLGKCPNCRSYRLTLEKIHGAVREVESGEVSGTYWKKFPSRIKERASSIGYRERKLPGFAPRWRWAWGGACLVLILVIGFSVIHNTAKKPWEVYVFSFEDSLQQIYQETESDIQLDDVVDSALLDSIKSSLGIPGEQIIPGFYGESSPWDAFTEEEITLLLSEIQSENKS